MDVRELPQKTVMPYPSALPDDKARVYTQTPLKPIPNLDTDPAGFNSAVKERQNTAQKIYENHKEALRSAPDLEDLLKVDWKTKKGEDPPQQINLSLRAVEAFQRTAREMQDLRIVIQSAHDVSERQSALSLFTQKKHLMEEFLAYGPSFEKAYWEYLSARATYAQFTRSLDSVNKLEHLLTEPAFKSVDDAAGLDTNSYARLENMMREYSDTDIADSAERREEITASLPFIYPEGSTNYEAAIRDLLPETKSGSERKRINSKQALLRQLDQQRKITKELWDDPMVRVFWQEGELNKLMKDFAAGKDILETQSTIKLLNTLYDNEVQHPNTTIGAILVGPPGVGKTTIVRHYLEATGRQYGYIDLSQDVTRYLLFGSKQLEFKTTTEYYKSLVQELKELDVESFRQFVTENSQSLMSTAKLSQDEAIVAYISQIQEALERGGAEKGLSEEIIKVLPELKTKVEGLAKTAFRKELAHQFATLVKKNGWRDGIVISLLRKGICPIFDEFPHFRDWTLLYSLITAKPGDKWFFADNNEWIDIPKNWKMYFTGNIGRKHGGFVVAEALASRAGGKVIEVSYPEPREEMQVALTTLADPEGDFLRTKEDLAKLYYTVFQLFPRIRSFTQDKTQAIPISYRTIRDLGEKLILYIDPKSGKPVYHPTEKSFDQALYDVLVGSYALYEDKTVPKEIVRLATTVGLFLSDEMKDLIIQSDGKGWIDEATYMKNKEAFEKNKTEYNQIIDDIRGSKTQSRLTSMPVTNKF